MINNNDNQNDNKKKKGIKLTDSMFKEIDKSLYNFSFDDDDENKDFYEFEDKNWDNDFTPIGTVDDEFFKPRAKEYITKKSIIKDNLHNNEFEKAPTKTSSLESQIDLKIDNSLKDEIVSIFDTHDEKYQDNFDKNHSRKTSKNVSVTAPTKPNKSIEDKSSYFQKEEEFTLFEEDKNNFNDENVAVDEQHIRSLMESAFYVYGHEGLSLHDLKKLTLASSSTIKKILKDWITELDSDSKRGVTIKNFGERYKFFTKNDNREELSRLITIKYRNPLSQKVMETLAIIAYNQPCTKAIIESIRGKDPTMTIQKLIDLGLVNEAGRGDGPGRPLLFTVSHKFYDIFGIKNVSDLPVINLEQPFQDDDISFFDTTRFND